MSKQIQDAYIVAATRLPVGKRNSAYATTRPDDMLAAVLQAALAQVPALSPERIDDVGGIAYGIDIGPVLHTPGIERRDRQARLFGQLDQGEVDIAGDAGDASEIAGAALRGHDAQSQALVRHQRFDDVGIGDDQRRGDGKAGAVADDVVSLFVAQDDDHAHDRPGGGVDVGAFGMGGGWRGQSQRTGEQHRADQCADDQAKQAGAGDCRGHARLLADRKGEGQIPFCFARRFRDAQPRRGR